MWHICALRPLIEMLQMKTNSKSIIQACSNEASTSLRGELNSSSFPGVLVTRVVYRVVQQHHVFVSLSVSPGRGAPSAATQGDKKKMKKERKLHTAFPNSIPLECDSEKLVLTLPVCW